MSAEMPQERINPYESPRELSAAAEDALRRQTPFGLTSPLVAAGTLTPEVLREAIATPGQPKNQGVKLFWTFLVASLGLAILVKAPWLLAIPSCVLSFAGVTWLARRWTIGETLQDVGYQCQELRFSEEGVVENRPYFEGMAKWETFTRCTCTGTQVFLQPVAGHQMLVPRSFWASDSDWASFVALVRHKVPEKTSRPIPVSDATVIPTRAQAEAAILGQGRLRLADLRVISRYGDMWGKIAKLAAVLLLPLPVPFGIAWVTSGIHLVDILALIFAILLLPGTVVVFSCHSIRKLAKAHRGFFAQRALAISESGVLVETDLGHSKMCWPIFAGFRPHPDYFFLCGSSRTTAQILPRSFFTEADWPKVVALVERKLSRL